MLSLKKQAVLEHAAVLAASGIVNQSRYRSKTIPTAGAILRPEDLGQQQESFEL